MIDFIPDELKFEKGDMRRAGMLGIDYFVKP